MDRKIVWEKWHNEEQHEEYYDDAELNDVEDHEEELSPPMTFMGFLPNMPYKISTPLGEFFPDDPLCPLNMCDCWVCHTNFRITDKDIESINSTDGVEIFEQMTPYRFFVGVGKMFSFATVSVLLQKNLCNSLKTSDMVSDDPFLDNAFLTINEAFMSVSGDEQWAIYLDDDGSVISLSPKDYGSYDEYYDALADLESKKTGNLMIYKSLNGV